MRTNRTRNISYRHNLSPRGDGNKHEYNKSRPYRDTTYPREGTETQEFTYQVHVYSDTTYPREGTETIVPASRIDRTSTTQLIPARGRKPPFSETLPDFHATQLIPARGRKRGIFFAPAITNDTTYPREGTETFCHELCQLCTADTTYPREGTETRRSTNERTKLLTQLIPARGRKPGKARRRPRTRTTQLIPARGRKLSLLIFYPPF